MIINVKITLLKSPVRHIKKYKITVVKNVTVPEVKTEQIDGLGKVALFSTNTQENSDIKANS